MTRTNGSQQRLLPLLWTGHLIEKKTKTEGSLHGDWQAIIAMRRQQRRPFPARKTTNRAGISAAVIWQYRSHLLVWRRCPSSCWLFWRATSAAGKAKPLDQVSTGINATLRQRGY